MSYLRLNFQIFKHFFSFVILLFDFESIYHEEVFFFFDTQYIRIR